MVKVLDFNANLKPETICTLFADTSSEVSSDMTIVGLPTNMKPAAGSALITAAGEIALLDSEGTWNFLE
ncbi:MAG: hypothetical protein IIY21_23700 [Clostridiales bacterium]|nr:hypothetical protein [Clostridiales bacterium]